MSRWTGGPKPEEGRGLDTKSVAAQSKGGGWGGESGHAGLQGMTKKKVEKMGQG